MQIRDVLVQLKAKRDELGEAKDRVKELTAQHDCLLDQATQAMDGSGVRRIEIDGTTYTRSERLFARVVDQDEFAKWCSANDIQVDSVRMFSASKLTSLAKETMDVDDGDLPAGVDVFRKPTMQMRRTR